VSLITREFADSRQGRLRRGRARKSVRKVPIREGIEEEKRRQTVAGRVVVLD